MCGWKPTEAYEADKRVKDNLSALLEEEPGLADFQKYAEKVRRERESWAEHWAEIIERKRAEEKLIPIKAVESTSDAISMADMSRKVIYLNQAFINLYGYTADKEHSRWSTGYVCQSEIAEQVFEAIQNGGSWARSN